MNNIELKPSPSPGLFPLLEIQLNGNLSYEKILSTVAKDYQIPYKLTNVDIEFEKGANYGKLILFLLGSQEENEKAFHFFKSKNINSTIKGYA